MHRPSHDRLTRLGTFRAYWIATIVGIGGFLFGYDSGVVGGVLTFPSFELDYRYGKKEVTRTQSLSVSLQELGAFVACFFTWPIARYLGRRKALMLGSFIFCVGVVIETIDTHSLAAFYVGRVIAGLGLGMSTVIIPMYNGEMAPKELRGSTGSFYQWGFTFGILIASWTNYGVSKHVSPKLAKQWQIPIAIQLIPGALMGLGMLTVKESTRWLTQRGRHDEAWESLKWVRADDSPATSAEMDEIREGVAAEYAATEGFRVKELLQPRYAKPMIKAFMIFTLQQATGATALAFFAPQFFGLLVGGTGTQDLLLTGIFSAIKVLACGIFVLFWADRLSRRFNLIAGAFAMAACQITVAAVLKTHPPPTKNPNHDVTSSEKATVALLYLFVIFYNMSWGPLPWPIVGEYFSPRIREIGIGVGVSAQWLFNFVFTLTTPYMFATMGTPKGWGVFLLWGLFDFLIAFYAIAFITETRGKSLEEITRDDGGRDTKSLATEEPRRENSGESLPPEIPDVVDKTRLS